uniref:Uncharacterized protein n=1 Tax=Anopheles coluzzii TaxID=1518534 RepID=A0A8W7Q0N3_ANOCL
MEPFVKGIGKSSGTVSLEADRSPWTSAVAPIVEYLHSPPAAPAASLDVQDLDHNLVLHHRPGSAGLPGRHLTRITIVSSTSRNSSMATNRARMAISPLLSRAIGQGCSWLGECLRWYESPSSNESSSRASASSSSPSATSPSSRTVVVCACDGFRVPVSSSTAPEVLSTSGAERISALERCGRKDRRVERSEGTVEQGRLTLLRQRESCTLGDSVSRLPISPPPDTSHVTRHWLAPGTSKLVPLHTSGSVAVQRTSAVTSDSLRTIRWTVSWSWQRGRADRREPGVGCSAPALVQLIQHCLG